MLHVRRFPPRRVRRRRLESPAVARSLCRLASITIAAFGPLAVFTALAAFTATAVFTAAAAASDWPQFRGANRDAISTETDLLRKWPAGGPKVLWTRPVCDGYAAAAILDGRVYANDYDRKASLWLVRCLSLDSGEELWQFSEKKRIRANHGITRTVPAVDEQHVFTLDPKCVLHCLDATSGKELWQKHLPSEYKTPIPPWYAGQCPLIEPDRVIVAPGGRAYLVALEKATGKVLWETANDEPTLMSHSSVMPAEIDGVRQYLHCNLKGVVGVGVDGKLLWKFPWKFNVSVPVSPLSIGDGRVFLTSCYEAETVMIRVTRKNGSFTAEKVFSLGPGGWNSEVHTPILYQDHLFAVGKKRRGQFTCLDLDGQELWASKVRSGFGLGSYLLADGMFFLLEGNTGILRLIEASPDGYNELDHAQVLSGHDVWAPMALADGKLVLRDMAKMKCIEVGTP
ncbi:MAG: PQQ-like beta-propeller repeat protein [Planctomycetia bacterium]|nr:MAG: PQQ-like beta-propeller repeat protein [Planctomycetia bacterium]